MNVCLRVHMQQEFACVERAYTKGGNIEHTAQVHAFEFGV